MAFKCKQCDITYTRKDALKRHQLQKHGEDEDDDTEEESDEDSINSEGDHDKDGSGDSGEVSTEEIDAASDGENDASDEEEESDDDDDGGNDASNEDEESDDDGDGTKLSHTFLDYLMHKLSLALTNEFIVKRKDLLDILKAYIKKQSGEPYEDENESDEEDEEELSVDSIKFIRDVVENIRFGTYRADAEHFIDILNNVVPDTEMED